MHTNKPKQSVLATIWCLLMMAVASASADEPGRSQSGMAYHGQFSAGFTLEGELLTCTAGSHPPTPPPFVRFRQDVVFERVPGVCDDLSDRPCDGRVTAIFERCFADSKFYLLSEDNPATPADEDVGVEYAKGVIRICYDESAAGNCEEIDEIARGSYTTQIQGPPGLPFIVNDPNGFDVSIRSVMSQRLKRSKPFKLDGKPVRLRPGGYTGTSIARAGAFCAARNACPVAATLRR